MGVLDEFSETACRLLKRKSIEFGVQYFLPLENEKPGGEDNDRLR